MPDTPYLRFIMALRNSQYTWILHGLLWGAGMFLILSVVLPLKDGAELHSGRLLSDAAIWLCAGLGYGRVLRWIRVSQVKETQPGNHATRS